MKKCPGCEREIDKYAIACDYCGKLDKDRKEGQDKSERGSGKGRDKRK